MKACSGRCHCKAG